MYFFCYSKDRDIILVSSNWQNKCLLNIQLCLLSIYSMEKKHVQFSNNYSSVQKTSLRMSHPPVWTESGQHAGGHARRLGFSLTWGAADVLPGCLSFC